VAQVSITVRYVRR